MAKTIYNNEQECTDFGEGISGAYHPTYLDKNRQSELINHLKDVPFTRVSYPKFGKIRSTPRLTFCYGQFDAQPTASYKGKSFTTEPLPQWLDELRLSLESFTSHSFNACILNKYLDGTDNIAWHQDDESFLEHHMVASLTLGCERDFQFRADMKAPINELTLISGSLFLIYSGLLHCVPKRAGVSNIRYNITFRCVKSNLGIGNYYYYNRGPQYIIDTAPPPTAAAAAARPIPPPIPAAASSTNAIPVTRILPVRVLPTTRCAATAPASTIVPDPITVTAPTTIPVPTAMPVPDPAPTTVPTPTTVTAPTTAPPTTRRMPPTTRRAPPTTRKVLAQ